MGGICSRRSTEDNPSGGSIPIANGHFNYGSGMVYRSHGLPAQTNSNSTPSTVGESVDTKLREPFSFPEVNPISYGLTQDEINDGIPRLSRALSNKSRSTKTNLAAVAKVSEVSSLLGKAGTAGFGKAVEVLDTLGSSMTNLNLSGGFVSGVAIKGNKITILAFEVANTVVKGANLMQALSKESIKHLKEEVLPSEGVQRLISKDMDELLRLAAADKRDELKVFSGEVVRFGNRCKDPQWHNLDRYFEKLGAEVTPQKQLKEEAETVMHQLMSLVQFTAELYHELHALDRFEQDYRRKIHEEDNSIAPQRGDSLTILRAELKSQKKHVRSLKKKSLWSKILEEVMEKLVDIVHFLHMEIHDAFGSADGDRPVKNNHQKLGSAGLALHYANIITQIDTLVTRSSSVPPNTRDALYQGLPPSIKSALRNKLQSFHLKEELSVPQIKAEMEKTLQWLVPIATNTTKYNSAILRNCYFWYLWSHFGNLVLWFVQLVLVQRGMLNSARKAWGTFTQFSKLLHACQILFVQGRAWVLDKLYDKLHEAIFPFLFLSLITDLCVMSPKIGSDRAHHGFGWVGEWANTGSEMNRKPAGQADLIRIETLHHADKEKTEEYILELVVWLHHLVSQSRGVNGGIRSPVKSPIRSPNQIGIQLSANRPSSPVPTLTVEDQEMLRDVSHRKLTPGISKSQEFDTARSRLRKHHRLSKSSSHSPTREVKKDPFPIKRPSSVPIINFDIDRIKALDVIDRVDNIPSV